MKLQEYYDIPKKDAEVLGVTRSGTKVDKENAKARAWILSELVTSYGLPGSAVQEKPGFFSGPADSDTKYCGFALKTEYGAPYFLGVIGASGNLTALETEFEERCKLSKSAQAGLISDGTRKGTRFLRRNPANDSIEALHDLDFFKSQNLVRPSLFKKPKGKSAGSGLRPLTRNIENLFFEAHSHIRDIDGLHADAALDELCKLMFTKIHDELTTGANEHYLFQTGLYNSVDECAAAIRSIYTTTVTKDIPDQLGASDRMAATIFEHEIKLSAPAIAKLVEALEAYDISGSDVDVKGRAFQRVFQPAMRAGMGQYFTPAPIIRLIVETISPTRDQLVLDPFAGSAHFLTECILHFRRNEPPSKRRARLNLFGIEKSPRMVRIAMTDMKLFGDGKSSLVCTDSLLDFKNYREFKKNQFDVIMTNPPFGSVLSADAIAKLGKFTLAKGRKKLPLEIVGLERCYQFLKGGGRLAIVLPESIFTNASTKFVREWISSKFLVRAIISLPIETFSPYGANIKTSVLIARKRRPFEKPEDDEKAFALVVENIGYDNSGRTRADSEIDVAIEALKGFIDEEGW